jgi:choline kinase
VIERALDVVVLAAGRGSRLADVGDERPKWLLEVAGQTIADRQLAGIAMLPTQLLRGLTVVTGHAAQALDGLDLAGARRLHNPRFLSDNNWLSVLTALRDLPEESTVVVLNGDLCAPPSWIASFLAACTTTPHDGMLAIDFERTLTDESMKVAATSTRELAVIGKQDVADPVGEYVGMLMARGPVLAALRRQLEAFDGDPERSNEWYEGAVGRTAAQGTPWHLWATPHSRWVEIDDLQDLAMAEALVDG